MGNSNHFAREAAMFRRRAISYLTDKGVRFEGAPSSQLLCSLLLQNDWIPGDVKAQFEAGRRKGTRAFVGFFDRLSGKGVAKAGGDTKSRDSFYDSAAWRQLRYRALQHYGGRCMCCGATAKDGVTIHVDHIKPRSKYPELELDFENVQPLCLPCNLGKSNLYETDWR